MSEHDDDGLLDAVAALDPVVESSVPDGSSPTARRLLEEIMSDTLTRSRPAAPPDPDPTPRRWRRLAAAAAAVAVAATATATMWPGATPSASASVSAAIAATLDAADGSARYTLVAEIGPATGPEGGDAALELRAEGVIADGDLSLTSRFGPSAEPEAMSTEELRLVDGDVYLRSTDLGGGWEVAEGRAGPADPLGFFDELGEIATFDEVGSDSIAGEPVTVYRADGARWEETDALSAAFVAFGVALFAGDVAPGDDPPVLELAVDDEGIVRRLDVTGEQGDDRLDLVVEVFDLGADLQVDVPEGAGLS